MRYIINFFKHVGHVFTTELNRTLWLKYNFLNVIDQIRNKVKTQGTKTM